MEGGGFRGVMQFVMRPWVATCDETRDRLSAHLDGELEGRERMRVLRHLARCEHCRALLRSLARAVERIRAHGQTDVPPPAPSLADAVVERLRHETR